MVAVEVRFREAIREASRMFGVRGRRYQALSLTRLNDWLCSGRETLLSSSPGVSEHYF